MGTLVVVENVSLDGVMQAPASPDEDTRGGFRLGGWAVAPLAADPEQRWRLSAADRDRRTGRCCSVGGPTPTSWGTGSA